MKKCDGLKDRTVLSKDRGDHLEYFLPMLRLHDVEAIVFKNSNRFSLIGLHFSQ